MKSRMRKIRVTAAAIAVGTLASSGVLTMAVSAQAAPAKATVTSTTKAAVMSPAGCRRDCL